MAGYSKAYFIGGLGGYQGADGINPIQMIILVGDADRQWLEVRYFDSSLKPMGKINTVIPEGPDHPNSLIDACIAFCPKHFKDCPSFNVVKEKMKKLECLDFHLGMNKIPKEWNNLRKEAIIQFKKLNIFEANLEKINFEK